MKKHSDVFRIVGSAFGPVLGFIILYLFGLNFMMRFLIYINIAIHYDTGSYPLFEWSNEHLAYLNLALTIIIVFCGIRFLTKIKSYKTLSVIALSFCAFYTIIFFVLNTYIKALNAEQIFYTCEPFSFIWDEYCHAELSSPRGWGLLSLAFFGISVPLSIVIVIKPVISRLINKIGKRFSHEKE
ncbi:MAG: hypothetical protein J5585_01580 [Clostridia bacterium]|nr:hypothetical protein [Clostridia bacterium]